MSDKRDIVDQLRSGFFLREEVADEIYRLRAQLASARKALELFADPASWRLGGSCDPNSGAFRGQQIAEAALTDEQGKS